MESNLVDRNIVRSEVLFKVIAKKTISRYIHKFRMLGNVDMVCYIYISMLYILAYQCNQTRNGLSWNYFYTKETVSCLMLHCYLKRI